jgi:hypothetical protein
VKRRVLGGERAAGRPHDDEHRGVTPAAVRPGDDIYGGRYGDDLDWSSDGDRLQTVPLGDYPRTSPESFAADLTATATTTAASPSYEPDGSFVGRSGEIPAAVRSSATPPPPVVWPSTTRTSTIAGQLAKQPHRVELAPAERVGRDGSAEVTRRSEPRLARPSVGSLVSDVTSDMSTLVRQEVDLAKAEVRQAAVRAGKGAGMFGGAVGAGMFAVLFLLLASMFGLSAVMALGWAALIIGALLVVSAGVLGLVGRAQVRKVHAKPTQTVETLKEDMHWAHGLRK